MASTPNVLTAANRVAAATGSQAQTVSRNAFIAGSASIHKHRKRSDPRTDRNELAKPWQHEAYRQVGICGEARYAAVLFANLAGRAEIGVSEPQAMARKAQWVDSGPEVDAFAEIAPTVRERSKLLRDFMLHRTIAGECYLVARERLETDPEYIDPPIDEGTGEPYSSWKDYLAAEADPIDPLDYEDEELARVNSNPNVENPIWEIVGVTELRKVGTAWAVRHDNDNWVDLAPNDPVIRFWNPDPEKRREAWSPFKAMLPTLREIEWETAHIFTQLRSRLMSAGVWFLPNDMTFPLPPADSVEGGETTIASLNEAELLMLTLANSALDMMDPEEVSFPTVVMGDPAALEAIDQDKLIQFWKDIDDKAMVLRSDAVRRFALGMDLPPEQVLGASGLAVSGTSGSAGSVNHWGVWANEEQTISSHVEPALDDFVGTLTTSLLRLAVEGTTKVIAYDTATLRLRQDRSKESLELYDRGLLSGKIALRENAFDPTTDMMDDKEFKRWLLVKIAGGSATPEQVNESLRLLGVVLEVDFDSQKGGDAPATAQPGRNNPRNLDEHPQQGPPQGDHEHNDAPFSAIHASCEALVLRAMEKAGNRLLNAGKRGRDRDRTTPPHLAHLTASIERTIGPEEFDFSQATILLSDLTQAARTQTVANLGAFCARLYNDGEQYSREALLEAV